MVKHLLRKMAKPSNCPKTPLVCHKQALYMFGISWLSAASAAYAISRGHYLYSLSPATVFLSSINYWRHPTIGWRRTLDIITVQCSLFFISFAAFNATYSGRFYILIALAGSCYPLSYFFADRGEEYMATLMHSYIHIIANLALVILFSGNI